MLRSLFLASLFIAISASVAACDDQDAPTDEAEFGTIKVCQCPPPPVCPGDSTGGEDSSAGE